LQGPGDHLPSLAYRAVGGRAASLTHKKKKKKKKKWKEVEAGVMCKWNLHRGGEVEAMRTRWYGSGSEEELVECAEQRRVYTIGISPAACGNDTSSRKHIIRAVITGKESIT